MTSRREDNKQRATHIRVLESLEAVISAHPAGSHLRTVTPDFDVHQPLRAVSDADNRFGTNVIDLRARFATARTSSDLTPNDAA